MIVIGGTVALTKSLYDGRRQVVGLRFARSLIVPPQNDSPISVIAMTDIDICFIPTGIMEKSILVLPCASQIMLAQTRRHLSDAHEWLLALGRKTALERVATFLLIMARRDHDIPSNGQRIELSPSRTELGDFLGLTVETTSRTLTKLRAMRVIHLEETYTAVISNVDLLLKVALDNRPARRAKHQVASLPVTDTI